MKADEGGKEIPLILEEFNHAAEKLEFDTVLAILADYARSKRTKDRILSMGILDSTDDAELSQGEISELVELRECGEDLPVSDWQDSWDILNRIGVEGVVAGSEDLARIAGGERTARRVEHYLAEAGEKLPLLSRYRSGFSIQEGLIKRISKTIGPDFEVLDSASRELARIRRQAGALRDRLRKDFAEFASRGGKGYEFVTVRGERYVVSMPKSEAARIKGIVHQVSASGASLYIEPLAFVDDNNRLESLVQDERREVERILGVLSLEVFGKRDELLGNQDRLLLLDAVSAKASFAGRFICRKPAHSTDGTLVLHEARHPLLERRFAEDGRRIKPLELSCYPALRTLVISGPNAGGKTVALKTIGLLVMMDLAGLLVPCREGTVIPDYRTIFVDIGDDQSIEKSLSTFSSRIVRMIRILELADDKSLVLIDEIGDGTDPDEGAALAGALLDRLAGICGRAIVTTHLSKLKGWAHENRGAVNATLEFDSERLEPLFNLRMGIPGRSWGIEMAGRLGLPQGIIEQAKDELGDSELRLEELLAHLERTERVVTGEREELLKKERLLSGLVESYRSELDRFKKDRDGLVQKAREEALDMVSSTRREMENLIREIRTGQAERKVILRSKEHLEGKRKDFEKKMKPGRTAVPMNLEDLKPGTWVRINSLDKAGRVLSVSGSSKVCLELRGGLRVETSSEDLSPAGDMDDRVRERKVSWTVDAFQPVTGELMVRGMEKEEALEKVDFYIDRAVLQGLKTVVIVHGIGKGILKRAIYDTLKKDPRVKDVRPGQPAYGGDGVAVVELK